MRQVVRLTRVFVFVVSRYTIKYTTRALSFPKCHHKFIINCTNKQKLNLTFMGPCIANVFLSTTNEMQRYTMLFITVSALHVSSGFSAHHQELKNCTCCIGYLSNLFFVTSIYKHQKKTVQKERSNLVQ
jgi:hypothetical protein